MKYLRSYNESKSNNLEISGYNHIKNSTYKHESGLFVLMVTGDIKKNNHCTFLSDMNYDGISIFVSNINDIDVYIESKKFYEFIYKYKNRIEDLFGSYEEFIQPLLDVNYILKFDLCHNTILIIDLDDYKIVYKEKDHLDIFKQMKERLLDIGIEIIDGYKTLPFMEIEI